jgi:hypothetical protein
MLPIGWYMTCCPNQNLNFRRENGVSLPSLALLFLSFFSYLFILIKEEEKKSYDHATHSVFFFCIGLVLEPA